MPFKLDGAAGGTFPSWSSAARPASPVAGQMGYNTTLSSMEYYNGTSWITSYLGTWTTAGRPSPAANGQFGFNTTLATMEFYNGTTWAPAASAIGTGGDQVFQTNTQTVSGSYTIASNTSAMSVGPITVANGVSVTVSANARYVIL